MIFDTHAHYDDEKYDADREGLISSLRQEGVGAVCNVSTCLGGIKASLELAASHEDFYCSVGVHPDDSKELNEEGMKALREAAGQKKVVAIGEIGLDYYWDETERSVQREWFARQLRLASDMGLPVIIHSREAAEDTLEVLRSECAGDIGGVMHCYSYDREYAKKIMEMDLYFGIGGVLTFKKAEELREVAAMVPLERIVLETDCPYLAPEPFRGKRNSSAHLKYVAERLAQVRGVSREEIEDITWENACRLYRINI